MFFTVAGSFTLAVSIALQHWVHGAHADVASGFLMGVSLGLLIMGLARPSRGASR
jgi:hypothetical protein